jgi:hypothetical protein
MVTLADVFVMNFNEKELHLNRDGELAERQRGRIQMYYERIGYNLPRTSPKPSPNRLFVILALMTLCPLLLIPLDGRVAALVSVLGGLIFIFWHVARRKSHSYGLIDTDLRSGKVLMTEGVPQVVFNEGNTFVEIDGVRMPASPNLALQFKSKDVYRVYYAPNTKVPLSYERVTIQD